MAIKAKSCSMLGRFCFRIGSVIALAGARDLLAIGTESGSFSKGFWTWGVYWCVPLRNVMYWLRY